jgi:hypothetical protein
VYAPFGYRPFFERAFNPPGAWLKPSGIGTMPAPACAARTAARRGRIMGTAGDYSEFYMVLYYKPGALAKNPAKSMKKSEIYA